MTRAASTVEHPLDSPELFTVIFQSHRFHPFVANFRRDRISEPISDELLHARRIKVRKIPARIPALETRSLRFGSDFVMPLPLPPHNLVATLCAHSERYGQGCPRPNYFAIPFRPPVGARTALSAAESVDPEAAAMIFKS